jgi:hypothetical protein
MPLQLEELNAAQGTMEKLIKKRTIFLALSLTTVLSVAQAAQMSPMESNIDRPGGDYQPPFFLPAPEPFLCQNSCGADTRCVAWNYDPRAVGATADRPACFLKGSAPNPVSSAGLFSGVKILGKNGD